MEQFRNFLEHSGMDIWAFLERAITVASIDFPQELRIRRDGLTERLYASHHYAKSFGEVLPSASDKMKGMAGVYSRGEQDDDGEEPRQDTRDTDDEEKEVHEDTVDDEMVEALNEEMEEERLLMKEILSIKECIKDIDQPEADVLEQLHRLQDLNISVEALKATEIGKEVNAFRKHPSSRVRSLTKKIVRSWKDLVDEWVKSASDISAAANGQTSSDIVDEEVGLPSPPLDEGALLAARTASLEMSQFFDFTDDDLSGASGPSPPTSDGLSELCSLGTRRTARQLDRRHSGGRASSPSEEQEARDAKGGASIHKTDKHRPVNVGSKSDPIQCSMVVTTSSGNKEKVPVVLSGVKPSSRVINYTESGKPAGGRVPPKQFGDSDLRRLDTRPASNVISKSNVETTEPGLLIKSKLYNSEVSEADRFAAAKRKLQENYQNHEMAKKMRTVQALDLTELPKGGPKAQRLNQTHHKNRGLTTGRR